jgi:hypothetical protein
MKTRIKTGSKSHTGNEPATSVLSHKRRPRGKAFAKGNTFGVRFVKGISGNPGGRPKYKKISEAARAALALDPDEKVKPRTNAEAMVLSAIKRARRGNIGALCAIADRCEGRPATSIHVDGVSDPLGELLQGVNAVRLKLYGEIEGKLATKESEEDDEGRSKESTSSDEGDAQEN